MGKDQPLCHSNDIEFWQLAEIQRGGYSQIGFYLLNEVLECWRK